MEEMNNTLRPAVTVVPDKEERRQIRKKYNLAALVIIINIIIFNIIVSGAIIIVCMALGGGFGFEAYRAGSKLLYQRPFLDALLSYSIPIISETVSIIVGVKLFRINLKKLAFNRDGYSGGTAVKLITITLGIQFVFSMLITIIQSILENRFGLRSATADLTPVASLPANLLTIFYACLLGPVLEELLYRGILLQSMRKYNERFAIILSALIFGLMHQNYQQAIPAFAMGIPLAIVTIKYNSIIPAIFAHIFANTTAIVQTYLIQYIDPDFFNAASSGSMDMELSSLSTPLIAVMFIVALLRIGFLIAAVVVGIISLVKGGNMKVPTPAGKSRAFPVFVTAVLWWVVFAAYLFLTFIRPFMI